MAGKANDGVYLGIDVGTGSTRAGIVTSGGELLGSASEPILMWRPAPDFVEQSSNDIWRAVCIAARRAIEEAGVPSAAVRGIGFDATCSLVVLDAEDRPVTVSPDSRDEQNVIVWMDHRATEQAQRINQQGHAVLRYVGGVISPEMETPKLLWLAENLPVSWRRAARFFDLPDFLVYRATGDETRSLCSTVCKWTYLGHLKSGGDSAGGGWDASYFEQTGLGDLAREGFRRLGRCVRPMGDPVPGGLSERAAREMGLLTGTAVGVSIIDAHAGGLGVLGAAIDGKAPEAADLERRLALIGGTSSCHMAVSREAIFVDGVWGPYYSAMVPGMWLNEGGQSATGALVDHVIFSHRRSAELESEARACGTSVYELLNQRLAALAEGKDFAAQLTADLHVLPYFHGNRSPRADPTLRGMVSGLGLGDTVDDLARLYLAAVQAVAHGTRHIVDTLNQAGWDIGTIFACGGGTKNPVFLREHADVSGCRIVLPREPDAVLVGSALLGAVAAGDHASVLAAMTAMNHAGEKIEPATGEIARFHRRKHAVFQRMYADQLEYRATMRRDSSSHDELARDLDRAERFDDKIAQR
jgi:FGGY-family pentulose kinase